MAITTALVEDRAQTTNNAAQATDSYTPTANVPHLLLAFATGEAEAAPTCAGNGMTWTRRHGEAQNASMYAAFTAPGIASPSAGATTVTYGVDAATGSVLAVFACTGADNTNPYVQSKKSGGAAGLTPAATFDAPVTAGNAVLYIIGDVDTNPPNLTEPSGFTRSTNIGYASPTSGATAGFHNNPGAVSTITAGATSPGGWGMLIVEIAAAAAGGATPIVTLVNMAWS